MNNLTEINQLIIDLEHLDSEIREEAALKLGKIASQNKTTQNTSTEEIVELLLKHLKDSSLEVREMIIYGLSQTKSERAIPSLLKSLKAPELEVRWASAEALGEIGSEKALTDLIDSLKKEQVWNVRASIVKSLAKIGSEKAINALIEQLKNEENYFVQREIIYAFKQLNFSATFQTTKKKLVPPTVLEYLKGKIATLNEQFHQDWQLITKQPCLVGAMGNEQEDSSTEPSKYLLRELSINGKEYKLKIEYELDNDKFPIFRFQLSPKEKYGMIPKGFKLRLLTENLEHFPDNVDEAEETRSELERKVKLEAGERMAWEIEPTPDNFTTEILPPFWNK